jgi:hypothetical protein
MTRQTLEEDILPIIARQAIDEVQMAKQHEFERIKKAEKELVDPREIIDNLRRNLVYDYKF